MARVIVAGLWVGGALTAMERLCIESFLANGYDFHLYTYGSVSALPAGVTVRDGVEILPASMIFQYREHRSYAGFANYFRYKLLLEKGGWWTDLDVVCLRPFPEADYVFAGQLSPEGAQEATNCVLFAPPGSDVMNYAWDICRAKDPGRLRWGETGPLLLQEAIRKFGLSEYVLSSDAFCPIPWFRWIDLVLPRNAALPPDTFAVHLWNEMWRRSALGKDEECAPSSLYERLKARFKVSCGTAAAHSVVGEPLTAPAETSHRPSIDASPSAIGDLQSENVRLRETIADLRLVLNMTRSAQA